MAYTVPTFNLLVNIGQFTGVIPSPWRLTDVPCALVYGRRVNVATSGDAAYDSPSVVQGMNLLLPALTDIRGLQDAVSPDFVECPAGTGRYYYVNFVDDIGKGWPNEHRTAGIFAIADTWTAPYP
jgi:hypothetical protein